MHNNRLLLIIISFFFIGCASTTIRHTKGYETVIANNTRTSVLPPEARVYEVDTAGKSKRLYDFEFNVESIIAEEIIPVLNEKNLKAQLLTRKNIHDLHLNADIEYLDTRFAEAENKLYHKAEEKEEIAFNINEDVGHLSNNITVKNPADILVLVSYYRNIKSSGSQALGFMSAALFGAHTTPADMANLRIAFIEAKTGKILWVNRLSHIHASFFSSAHKDEERKVMRKYLSTLLEKFNKQK